ncbi:exodeoxyribonuclease V subunit alpha [Comamonas thiooxydans]|uniref:RecBCD enzyme subunit RecD n=1 Tax=Comamonas thiooxydans TaxID=363952 RepID=A0A0E3BTM1_9BURK|nr:exodeoxyribonuclease V subunit alpha [Comamonas thiooxydans]KGH03458.1 exodeoxyribonuclease V subunit alpha [Comamonas thiooxydans]KGH17347.1 exodeoxyribonuclease V subunit alpha [Comamonas thiooxydans]KGH18769.1 exodeoxyribonuclease V subunit alpha [Comamonas thiooxydans]
MKGRRKADLQTLDLFAAPADGDTIALGTTDWLAALERLADAGLLRRLDSALAAFVAAQDAEAGPALLVATAVLAQMEGRGHSCLPLKALAGDPNQILAWPKEAERLQQSLWEQLPGRLADWLQALRRSHVVRVVQPGTVAADRGQPLVLLDGAAPLLYLRRYWDYERSVAAHITQRTVADAVALDEPRVRDWLGRLFSSSAVAANAVDWQKLACALALRGRMSVITGGPGTGKTYTAARLLALLFATAPDAAQLRVALAAPTGKAAARLKQSIDSSLLELKEAVGRELDLEALVKRMGAARTLHSLLGARPDTRRFAHHAGNPLDVDVLIVDEASMIHLEMMAALLQALPPTARLILLGDKDQLASVEAGAVLGDLCRDAQRGNYAPDTAAYVERVTGQSLPGQYLAPARALPLAQHTVMLRESRRFGGPIGLLAQAVNAGDAPAAMALLRTQTQAGQHAELWAREGGEVDAVVRSAVQGRGGMASYAAYAEVLERHGQGKGRGFATEAEHRQWVREVLAAFDRYRLLCAVRDGSWGVAGLNRAVEQALQAMGVIRKEGEWYMGRPVMVTRNDTQLGVFNGDIGMVLPSFADPARLRVYFMQGEHLHHVSTARLAHVETAFAMTVHKSQGSEFEHTALVLAAQGGNVLSRELVYTGITRARKAFSLWAEAPGLLASAMGSPTQRSSGLLGFMESAR